MSRNRERPPEDERSSSACSSTLRAGEAGLQLQGGLKRKAVAPGYLRDLLQAKQRMKSMGLKAADAHPAASSGSISSGAAAKPGGGMAGKAAAAAGSSGGGQEQLYVPPTTLPLLFAQRKKFLQRSKLAGTPQPYRLHEELPAGLLSLPEDVVLKIVCYLHHDEIRPLFQVCKQLNTTLKTAVHFHFNYATPYRHMEEAAPLQPRPERQRKRSATNLAAVLSHLTRSGRLTAEARAASGHTTAPRALFADTNAGRDGGGRRPALSV